MADEATAEVHAEKPVRNITARLGRPPAAEAGNRRQEIAKLREEGMTQKQIAEQLGITPAAVYYHLKRLARSA